MPILIAFSTSFSDSFSQIPEMYFENEAVDMDMGISYSIQANMKLSPFTKMALEKKDSTGVMISLVAEDGEASLRTYQGTQQDAHQEYRRLANLVPKIEKEDSSSPSYRLKTARSLMDNMKMTGILATHTIHGLLPLPPKVVALAQDGHTPTFKVMLDSTGRNDGTTRVTVSGTSIHEKQKELVRVNQEIRARRQDRKQGNQEECHAQDQQASGSGMNGVQEDHGEFRNLRGMGRANRGSHRGGLGRPE